MINEIWTLEESYFAHLYEAEYEQVLALVHDRFLAWPDSMPRPIDKEGTSRFMQRLVPEPTSYKVTIEREGIQVLGGVAVTQFIINVSNCDAEAEKITRSSRITHTWVKEGESWKLLGGMSCDRESAV